MNIALRSGSGSVSPPVVWVIFLYNPVIHTNRLERFVSGNSFPSSFTWLPKGSIVDDQQLRA